MTTPPFDGRTVDTAGMAPTATPQYVATITYSYQDGPESMAREQRHKIMTAETTIGELVAWYRIYYKGHNETGRFPVGPITIQESDHA